MKFICFGNNVDDSPTIHPVDNIDQIVLYDQIFMGVNNPDDFGEFKILLFLKGYDKGIAERFQYDLIEDMPAAQEMARKRFSELLEQLNG